MIKARDQKNKLLVIALIIPITILAKFVQFTILPDKYFYDSSRMLSMLTGSNTMLAWGGGYEVVVNVFKKIDLFKFTTLQEWAIFLASIFALVLVFMVAKIDRIDFWQSVFLLLSVGLLNIYVFNISKEIIQYAIFFIMYLVIVNRMISPNIKLILCFAVFFWESTFFRSYYILMGALFVLVYFIFKWVQLKNKKMTAKRVSMILVIIFVAVFLLIFMSKFIAYDEYQTIINVSESHENAGAVTAINDLIKVNGNLFLFMINYVINAVRMMIPIELLIKGPFYAPFVIYQVFIMYYLVKSIKMINRKTNFINIISTAVFCGYLLGSFMFEPDFGSFVRHEAATFPILILMVMSVDNLKVNKESN